MKKHLIPNQVLFWEVKLMKKALGQKGEALAMEILKQSGYKIIEKNFICKIGEIDIIALDKETLAFIEVRSRKETTYGIPLETVTYPKQRKIRQVAQYYLVKNKLEDNYCRFDVVSIIWGNTYQQPQVEIIRDAF
jgi:putative endonuclease